MELKSSFKLSLISLLVAAPTIALAQPSSNCPLCTFNGFTVGVGVGATTFMNKSSTGTLSESGLPDFFPIDRLALQPSTTLGNAFSNNASNNIYKYGPMGALFVGYGQVFDSFYHSYLGAELGLNVLGANNTNMKVSSSDFTSTQFTVVENSQYGIATYSDSLASHTKVSRNSLEPFLDVKLGLLMTPTALVYLRGGINYNTIKVKTDGTYDASGTSFYINEEAPFEGSSSVSTTSSFGSKSSKGQIGYRAGIGMEVMVTPEFGIGADYIYSFYPNVKTTAFNGSASDVACDIAEGCIVIPANLSSSSKATNVSDQQVMAQLIYHFGG